MIESDKSLSSDLIRGREGFDSPGRNCAHGMFMVLLTILSYHAKSCRRIGYSETHRKVLKYVDEAFAPAVTRKQE
jgi:hypothetical protein